MSRPAHTFYEFFAGGGMARLGLGEGWDCAFANDFDPVKARAYRANFGGEDLKEGDVWALTADDLPGRADLAWASSPCQDFSLAGGRAGLKGGRSSAFFGFWRLVEALAAQDRAPRLVVIENVVGLLTSHGGADFTALCQALADQGYAFGAIEVDAARFLPQSRRRILVIACRAPPPHLPRGRESRPGLAPAFARLPAALQARWIAWPQPQETRRNTDLAALLEPEDDVRWHSAAATDHILSLLDSRNHAKVAAALAEGVARVGAVYRRTRAGRQRAEVRFDGLAGCLRTPRGGSSRQTLLVTGNGAVRTRLISPRESARLMGLPDTYVLPDKATAALMVTGDGVAVPVVRWLTHAVLEPLLSPGPSVLAAE